MVDVDCSADVMPGDLLLKTVPGRPCRSASVLSTGNPEVVGCGNPDVEVPSHMGNFAMCILDRNE